MEKEIFQADEYQLPVESRCGAVALGLASLFPSLSFDGALIVLP